MKGRRLRILIAKVGLDGHDRGAKVVARALRDAGFEVIYTGLRQTPELIAETAIQEDVHCVGVSILSGAHNRLLPEIKEELEKRGGNDIVLFAGGIIPQEDIPYLESKGVEKIFHPGTSLSDIISWIKKRFNLVEENQSS